MIFCAHKQQLETLWLAGVAKDDTGEISFINARQALSIFRTDLSCSPTPHVCLSFIRVSEQVFYAQINRPVPLLPGLRRRNPRYTFSLPRESRRETRFVRACGRDLGEIAKVKFEKYNDIYELCPPSAPTTQSYRSFVSVALPSRVSLMSTRTPSSSCCKPTNATPNSIFPPKCKICSLRTPSCRY